MTNMYDILGKWSALEQKTVLSEGKQAKPDFLDADKDGDKKEPMKKALKDKKDKKSDSLSEMLKNSGVEQRCDENESSSNEGAIAQALHQQLEGGADYRRAVADVSKQFGVVPRYVVDAYEQWGNFEHDDTFDESTSNVNEGRMAEVDQIFLDIASGDMDIYDLYQAHATDPVTKFAQDKLQDMYDEVARDHRLHPDDDFEEILDIVAQQIEQDYANAAGNDAVPLREFAEARMAAIRSGKPTFMFEGVEHKVAEGQRGTFRAGSKSYFKAGQQAVKNIQKNAREKAAKEKEEQSAKKDKVTETANGKVEAYGVMGVKSKPWRKVFSSQAAFEKWLDRHEGDVEVQGTRSADAGSKSGNVKESDMEVGKSRKTQFGKVTQVAPNVTRHTREYDREPEADDDEDMPRGKGRPKGVGKKIGAKGPTGRSKLMKEEGQGDDIQAAIELLMNNGYTVGKLGTTEEAPLDEKAVSKKQQRFMGMVHAAQKGEKPASKEVAKVAKTMGKKDVEDFASTKQKGLPEKKKDKKEEAVEETTTSGSVATAPGGKSKGGVYGQGVYEAKLAESFEAHLASVMGGTDISIDDQGNMKVTVGNEGGMSELGSAEEPGMSPEMVAPEMDSIESPEASSGSLDDILKLSGLEPANTYEEVCPSCGSADCTCDMVDEAGIANAPDPQYSGIDTMVNTLSAGLNGRKSTGQTTVPVLNKDPARQGHVSTVAEEVKQQSESRLWDLYKKIEGK